MAELNTRIELFPALPPLADWEDTYNTLHLFVQITGKIRLKMMPRRNHWWNATLYITPRGFSTGAMPFNNRTFECQFNFIEHFYEISTCEGKTRKIPLVNGLSVADFYKQVFKALNDLDIKVKILAKPYDLKINIPFAEDHEHKTYDAEMVNLYWHALYQMDQVFKEFSGRFYGKSSPVQLFWHHFDLTLTRYSGKKAPAMPEASVVEKEAYSHEDISFGFWAGDDQLPEPTFYSYTYPLPAGIEKKPLKPASAAWGEYNGSPMALLSYANLRKEADRKQAVLDFMESAYQAGAKLAKWPINELSVPPLEEL